MKARICDICERTIRRGVKRCKIVIYDYDAWTDIEYGNKLDLCPSCTDEIIRRTKEEIKRNKGEQNGRSDKER